MEYRLLLTKWHDTQIAVLIENGRITEIHPEYTKDCGALHEIYMGKVLNVIPAQDAAYMEIQKGVLCFLPLGGDKAKSGDVFPVQIIKEASGLKKAAVSKCLSLIGRYCIVSEEKPELHVSSRLSSGAKKEIRSWLLEEDAFSEHKILIRTAAEDADRDAILREIALLQNKIAEIRKKSLTEPVYGCLYREEHYYTAYIQRLPANGDVQIITDQEAIYKELINSQIPVGWKIHLYEDAKTSLSSLYRIESCIEGIRRERIWLKNGGFLVIQRTEALTVIDVNSGKHIAGRDKEKAVWQTNLEAAQEIAFQIRLRNLSGIILVDFINMENQELKKSYQDAFKKHLKEDRIPTKFVDETALQLVEITRKKTGPPIEELLFNMKKVGDDRTWQRKKRK